MKESFNKEKFTSDSEPVKPHGSPEWAQQQLRWLNESSVELNTLVNRQTRLSSELRKLADAHSFSTKLMDKLRGTETRSDKEWALYNELKKVNSAIKILEKRRNKAQSEWGQYQKANRDKVQKSEYHFSSPRLNINESYKNRVMGSGVEAESPQTSSKTSNDHFLKRKTSGVTIIRDSEDELIPPKEVIEESPATETVPEGDLVTEEKPLNEQIQEDIEKIVEGSNDEYKRRRAEISDRERRERLAEQEIQKMKEAKRRELETAYSSAPESLSAEPEKPKDIVEELAPMFEVVQPRKENVSEGEEIVEDGPSFETQEITRENPNDVTKTSEEFIDFQRENNILDRTSFDTDEEYEKYLENYIYDNFYSNSKLGPKYSTEDPDHDEFMEGYRSVEEDSRRWVKELEQKNNDIWNTGSAWLYTKIKTGADSNRPMGRIYANFDPHGSVGFQLAVVEGLYEAGVRSDVKTPSSEMLEDTMDNINRADKVVIYFNLNDAQKVKEVVEKAGAEFAEYAIESGPRFTEELRGTNGEVLSGLYYGEEPFGQEGESFGETRVKALKDAYIKSLKENSIQNKERFEEILREELLARNIDPENLARNINMESQDKEEPTEESPIVESEVLPEEPIKTTEEVISEPEKEEEKVVNIKLEKPEVTPEYAERLLDFIPSGSQVIEAEAERKRLREIYDTWEWNVDRINSGKPPKERKGLFGFGKPKVDIRDVRSAQDAIKKRELAKSKLEEAEYLVDFLRDRRNEAHRVIVGIENSRKKYVQKFDNPGDIEKARVEYQKFDQLIISLDRALARGAGSIKNVEYKVKKQDSR